MESYTERRHYGDKFITQAILILAKQLNHDLASISVSDDEADRTQATDLILPDGKTIGLRVRRYNQIRYQDEITIRTYRGRDGLTEWEKILMGKVSYILYGFSDEAEKELIKWIIIDPNQLVLAAFFDWKDAKAPTQIVRPEKQCSFLAFHLPSFLTYTKLIIAESD